MALTQTETGQTGATGPASSADAATMPVYSSDALLAGSTMAQIVHGGQTYYLRKTRQGKLILYK